MREKEPGRENFFHLRGQEGEYKQAGAQDGPESQERQGSLSHALPA